MTGVLGVLLGDNASGAAEDAATTAWVAAVVGAGGTVSAGRRTLVNTMLTGLRSDGVLTSLDRMWILAAENSTSALRDMIAASAATAVNTPTFVADRGYTSNGSTSYLNSNFNPSTAGGNYAQNSSCIGSWNRASMVNNDVPIGLIDAGFSSFTQLFCNSGTTTLGYVQNAGAPVAAASDVTAGMFLANRSSSTNNRIDKNGSTLDTQAASSSAALVNDTFYMLARNVNGSGAGQFCTVQIAFICIGGSLTLAQSGNLYSRVQTYMTAVGA